MTSYDDLRIGRERLASALEDLDRSPGDTPDCAAVCVAKTFAEGTYPTTAGRYYACHPVGLGGPEAEGGTPTFDDGAGVIHVLNLGSKIPPAGTRLVATQVGDRWITRYDGPE